MYVYNFPRTTENKKSGKENRKHKLITLSVALFFIIFFYIIMFKR